MPSKTNFVDEAFVRSVALPNHGGRYTVIPHAYVIDTARAELATGGFQISSETYKTTKDGQIAQGIYNLVSTKDPDMGMMFAWSNSYNKMLRFKCAVGGQVFVCMNGVVSGDLANYKRKHTGSALHDVIGSVQFQLQNAQVYYDQLIQDKEMLKNVLLTKKEQGSLLGRLFAEQELLTLTQVGIVKRELDKPSFNYNADPDSAWSLYNHITLSLKDSHPLHYLDDHQDVHSFFVNEFGQLKSSAPVSNPVEELYYADEVLKKAQQAAVATEEEDTFGVNFM